MAPKSKVGLGGAKRHKKILPKQPIKKAYIKKLARRAGIKLIKQDLYDDTREAANLFLKEIISNAVEIMLGNNRKTISGDDIRYALKLRGLRYYG